MSACPPPVVGEWLARRLPADGASPAVEGTDGTYTYAGLEERADAAARGLVARGLRPGDVVAVLSENLADVVVLLFACAKAGLLLAPLNWRLTAAELVPYLTDIAPALLVASDPKLEVAIELGAPGSAAPLALREALDGEGASAPLPAVDPHDGVMLVATSGSTGRPKAAVLTHRNFLATNRAIDGVAPIRRGDVVLQFLPQFHVGGWNVQPMQALLNGASLLVEPGFDAGRILEAVESKQVTTMACVPTSLLMLAEHPRFASTDLSSLQSIVIGGAAASQPAIEAWSARGVALHQGYGLTEAGPNVLCLPSRCAEGRAGAVGWPYPSVEVALQDERGELVDGEGEGELLVKGPSVFRGYWKDDAATAAAFQGGWLRTGDVASRDADGCFRIVGRRKDMYVSGGENVYPAEVERVLVGLAGVSDAAVVGVADARWGEAGVAFVEVKPGATVTVDAVLAHCRSQLAGYKIPAQVVVVDALPRTSLGKADKVALRARANDDARDRRP